MIVTARDLVLRKTRMGPEGCRPECMRVYLEAVPNAVIIAGSMFLTKRRGFLRVNAT